MKTGLLQHRAFCVSVCCWTGLFGYGYLIIWQINEFGRLTKTGSLWGRVCIVFVSVQSKPICTTQHHITVVKRY